MQIGSWSGKEQTDGGGGRKDGMMQRLQRSEVEETSKNMALKKGRREKGHISPGSHQGLLMVMRDGVQ